MASASCAAVQVALVLPLSPVRLHLPFQVAALSQSSPPRLLATRCLLFPLPPSSNVSPRRASSVGAAHAPLLLPGEEEDIRVLLGEREEEASGPPLLDASAEREMRSLPSPEVEVMELEELPEQWRRSKIAWLCKELPSYKHSTLVRILNAQRKWITQHDATYVAVHCIRIRENDAAFRVYMWMSQQHWYRFDFALATKLADCLGKDRKIAKCREMYDAIIEQGRVPNETTFHILTAAYLGAPVDGCLEDACSIYNQMIQLGGYRPKLSLHNSLFRALVSKTGGTSKHYLKQAEFIYHNLVTCDLEIHKDIYAGILWLHSYQDVIDTGRVRGLRKEMKQAGIEETREVLVSIMRAFSKEGDVNETEQAWLKLLQIGCDLPTQAFVCRMELYAKVGEPMKSLEIFKGMREQRIPLSVAAFHKIIQIMSKSQEVKIAETLLDEFIVSSMKHLMPAFLDLMYMYYDLSMHDNLELTFKKCLARCRPNRIMYNIYLDSLVRTSDIEKAEEIFKEMHANGAIGTNAKSCNIILGGYLDAQEYMKAEKIYDMMRQKNYDIKPDSLEKLQSGLILNRKVVRKTVTMKLDQEQREILIGLLVAGGARMESDEQRRNHIIHFKFREDSDMQCTLRIHVHQRFHEWLAPSSKAAAEDNEIAHQFSTIAHSYFGFFADQFWPKGQPTVPKLIHRWLSPRVLAYWYMSGGFRLQSGDMLLKLVGGSREDVEKIAKWLRAWSLVCKAKRKDGVLWMGFQGSNADSFWKLMEPYLLDSHGKDSTDYGITYADDGRLDDSGDGDVL